MSWIIFRCRTNAYGSWEVWATLLTMTFAWAWEGQPWLDGGLPCVGSQP